MLKNQLKKEKQFFTSLLQQGRVQTIKEEINNFLRHFETWSENKNDIKFNKCN